MNTDKPTNEALAARAKAGDREALAALWEQNKGVLFLMVKRQYMGHKRRAEALGVELEDAQQVGFFAVQRAVQSFDPQAGGFLTYLGYFVRSEVQALLGLRTERQRREPMAAAERLEADLPGTEDITIAEAVPDPAAQADFEAAEARTFNTQLRQALEASIDTLKPAEAQAVRGRHFEGKTLQTLGDELGVSQERARQIERMALRRLRGRPALQAYREEITSRAYRGTGFAAWKANGSAPERWTEWAEAKEAQRRRDEERCFMEELARFEEECGIWTKETEVE